MNNGVPPTERKARTGEFTPPGITFFAARNSFSDCFVRSRATRMPPGEVKRLGELYLRAGRSVKETILWKCKGFPT